MIEVVCNDRLGKKVRVKCNTDDTIGDLKKLIAAQTGTRWNKIVLKKWYTIFKDHVSLGDCILFLTDEKNNPHIYLEFLFYTENCTEMIQVFNLEYCLL